MMPKWLLDPEGPVRVRPGYLPRLAPWLLRFLAAGRPSRVRDLAAANAALCGRVYDDLLPLLADAGLSHMLGTEGCLALYANEAEFAADRDHLAVLERFGLPHEVLGGNAIRAREPAISTAIPRAVLFPNNRTVSSPYGLVAALAERFAERGGRIENGEVVGFDRADGAIEAVRLRDGRRLNCANVVLCAGAHTGQLSRMTQIGAPGIELGHSLIWPARAFMISPTAGGIRVGGTVEFGGLDAPPDYRRARVLVRRAQQALPGLVANEAVEWMGHRPALPDTIPIIGPSVTTKGVFYATGHGHLGLTQSATTARLIADLMTGRAPPIDITPYRVNRF